MSGGQFTNASNMEKVCSYMRDEARYNRACWLPDSLVQSSEKHDDDNTCQRKDSVIPASRAVFWNASR